MEQKKFIQNKKAHKLYAKTPLFKALLIVILPGLLMSLMSGIYVFADQLLLALLVPGDTQHSFEKLFEWSQDDINGYIKTLTAYYGDSYKLTFFGSADIVKAAISISSPLTLVLTALPLFLATGSGVMFTQSIGGNNRQKGHEIFKTSFWMVIAFSVFLTIVIAPMSKILLNLFAGVETNLPSLKDVTDPTIIEAHKQMNLYYDKVREIQIDWAFQYVVILACFLPVSCMVSYLAILVRSEGRFKIITITMIISNILNIFFDFILIKYAELGMIGGALATFIGALFNLVTIIFYIRHIKKNGKTTWLDFAKVKLRNKIDFRLGLVTPIIFIGLSGFLIEFSYSLTSMFYLPTLASLSQQMPAAYPGEYFITISGAVIPIVNLFFIGMWGVIEGGRIIQAYNYSVSKYDRVRKAYWYTIIIGFTYGLFCFFVVVFGLSHVFFKMFQIQNDLLKDANRYLLLEMLLIPIFAWQISAVVLFQSTNRIVLANIASVTQDVICFYPMLAIMTAVTVGTGNIWMLISVYAINSAVAAGFLTTYSTFFMKHRLGRRIFKVKITRNRVIKLNVPYNKRRVYKKFF